MMMMMYRAAAAAAAVSSEYSHTAACVCVCVCVYIYIYVCVCVTEQVAGDELSPQCLDLRVGRLLSHSKVSNTVLPLSVTHVTQLLLAGGLSQWGLN